MGVGVCFVLVLFSDVFVLTLGGYVLLVASGSFFRFLPHFFFPSTTHRHRGVLGGAGRRGRVLCVKMCMKVVFVVVGLVIESWRICNFLSGLSIVTAGMQLV